MCAGVGGWGGCGGARGCGAVRSGAEHPPHRRLCAPPRAARPLHRGGDVTGGGGGAGAVRGRGAHAAVRRPRRCSSGAVPKRRSAERAMARDGKGRGQTPAAAAAEPGLRERGP